MHGELHVGVGVDAVDLPGERRDLGSAVGHVADDAEAEVTGLLLAGRFSGVSLRQRGDGEGDGCCDGCCDGGNGAKGAHASVLPHPGERRPWAS